MRLTRILPKLSALLSCRTLEKMVEGNIEGLKHLGGDLLVPTQAKGLCVCIMFVIPFFG